MKAKCKFLLDKDRCPYTGNKYYNYGFVQGTAGYCYYSKQWVSDITNCPLEDYKEESK